MDAEDKDTLKGLALRIHNAAQNFLAETEVLSVGDIPPGWVTAVDDLRDATDALDGFLWELRVYETEF